MFAANFDYYRPTTLAEAVQLLQTKENAKILAGGHSLLPAMKLRVAQPSALIDISRVPGLSGISATPEGNLKIGAMTTHATIASSDLVKQHCPVLAETAAQIGDQMVRNRGTIGGSLAHADPAADYPAAILAVGAKVTAAGPSITRTIPIESFFTDLFTTALKPDEVLTEIVVNGYGKGTGAAYVAHPHPASGYCVVGAAAVVTLKDGKCSYVNLVIGGATANPVSPSVAELALTGKEPTADAVSAASKVAAVAIKNPLSDTYASSEYRTHLATVMAKRALMMAVERAQS